MAVNILWGSRTMPSARFGNELGSSKIAPNSGTLLDFQTLETATILLSSFESITIQPASCKDLWRPQAQSAKNVCPREKLEDLFDTSEGILTVPRHVWRPLRRW